MNTGRKHLSVFVFSLFLLLANPVNADQVASVKKDNYQARELAKAADKLRQEGRHLEAIEKYQKAIGLNQKYEEAYYNRGNSYDATGDKRRAIKDYDKVLELNPQYAKAYNSRGNAYFGLGNKRQAIMDYSKAIEINPQYAKAYYNRGMAYSALEDNNMAREDWKRSAKLGNKAAQRLLYEKGVVWE